MPDRRDPAPTGPQNPAGQCIEDLVAGQMQLIREHLSMGEFPHAVLAVNALRPGEDLLENTGDSSNDEYHDIAEGYVRGHCGIPVEQSWDQTVQLAKAWRNIAQAPYRASDLSLASLGNVNRPTRYGEPNQRGVRVIKPATYFDELANLGIEHQFTGLLAKAFMCHVTRQLLLLQMGEGLKPPKETETLLELIERYSYVDACAINHSNFVFMSTYHPVASYLTSEIGYWNGITGRGGRTPRSWVQLQTLLDWWREGNDVLAVSPAAIYSSKPSAFVFATAFEESLYRHAHDLDLRITSTRDHRLSGQRTLKKLSDNWVKRTLCALIERMVLGRSIHRNPAPAMLALQKEICGEQPAPPSLDFFDTGSTGEEDADEGSQLTNTGALMSCWLSPEHQRVIELLAADPYGRLSANAGASALIKWTTLLELPAPIGVDGSSW